jgi:isopentenyldiphosphate isomerase
MAKIDRYDGNLRAFGSSATGTERTVFGDTSQSDTLDDNVVADFFRGWGITGPTFNPTKQDFNGLGFTLGQLIAYLHQQGIPEWNTSQECYQGSVVTTLAGIYRLKNGGDATVDPDNDNGTNWELAPTRAQVDAKANQATTYTETEVDNLLDDKADQANTYTETEVDELTGSLAYPNTTLASSSDISENLREPITAYPHIQGFRTGTGTALTFAQVVEEAAERGARLLTIQELEAGVAAGAGFTYDTVLTWTSSPAGVGLVYGNLGDGNGTRVVLNTSTDTAAGGYAVSVIGQRQWTDTQYADKATTYTETEVDSLLNAKADKATTYTEAEVDSLLDAKANQATTYTETEVDSLLNAKADKATTYTEAEVDSLLDAKANQATTYTETEVDGLLNAKADKATTYTEAEVDSLLNAKANLSGATFAGNISATNLSGTNTGDQTLREIGVGQTWQNVTSSRVKNTTYTNSTGKPIQVFIIFDPKSADSVLTINGIAVPTNDNNMEIVSFIVPNSNTYKLSNWGVYYPIKWLELR